MFEHASSDNIFTYFTHTDTHTDTDTHSHTRTCTHIHRAPTQTTMCLYYSSCSIYMSATVGTGVRKGLCTLSSHPIFGEPWCFILSQGKLTNKLIPAPREVPSVHFLPGGKQMSCPLSLHQWWSRQSPLHSSCQIIQALVSLTICTNKRREVSSLQELCMQLTGTMHAHKMSS